MLKFKRFSLLLVFFTNDTGGSTLWKIGMNFDGLKLIFLWCIKIVPQGASTSVVGGKTPTTASIVSPNSLKTNAKIPLHLQFPTKRNHRFHRGE
jgi:hypothetical protein